MFQIITHFRTVGHMLQMSRADCRLPFYVLPNIRTTKSYRRFVLLSFILKLVTRGKVTGEFNGNLQIHETCEILLVNSPKNIETGGKKNFFPASD